MPLTPDHDESWLIPPRMQRVIAALTTVGLVAVAGWYVVLGGLQGRLVHHDEAPAADGAFTVNINAATAAELAVLPGLGPATAARIVEHRREHGPFTSIEGLLDVPGIGPATLEALRTHLRPIRPRKASP
ncbi:MAG: ComEA family DNA-binding protein [Pirellulales bacterium]